MAIASYPSLAEFESLGVPLAASESALRAVGEVPEFLPILQSVRGTRASMLSALGAYNRSPEGHQPLTFADALWGRLVVETSNLASKCGFHLAPLADLVNHSNEPNVEYSCTPKTGKVELLAKRDIAPGEELTATSHVEKHVFIRDPACT